MFVITVVTGRPIFDWYCLMYFRKTVQLASYKIIAVDVDV